MATCRECLHYDACYEWGNMLDPIHGGVVCDSFTPKSDYVKRERGERISLEPEIGLFKCSLCDHIIVHGECNFCPNCGSDIRKEDNNANNIR